MDKNLYIDHTCLSKNISGGNEGTGAAEIVNLVNETLMGESMLEFPSQLLDGRLSRKMTPQKEI